MRQGERLVEKTGTHNVKFLTRNWTKQLRRTHVHGQRQAKHVRLRRPVQAVARHTPFIQNLRSICNGVTSFYSIYCASKKVLLPLPL